MLTRRARRSIVASLWAVLFAYVVVTYALRGQISWWTPVTLFAALYIADALSGIAHFVVDYTPNVPGVGLKELFHYQGSRASQDYKRRRKQALSKINGFQELVFDFKIHHRTPAALGRRSFLVMTVPVIVYGALPITLGLVVLGEFGWMPPNLSLFVVVMVACGTLSQYVHACTHKKPIPWGARLLQAVGLFISPKAHDVHHRHPERQFCLLNGWANPLVDQLFKFALWRGYFRSDGLRVI